MGRGNGLPIALHNGTIGKKLLLMSATGNLIEVMKCLEDGANVDECDEQGWTPTMYAANTGRYDCLKALIDHGCNVNKCKSVYNLTALMLAAMKGRSREVKLLMDAGVHVDSVDTFGRTALSHAVLGNYTETVKILLENNPKANPNIPVNDTETPLIKAAARGQADIIDLLLQNGANFNTVATNGRLSGIPVVDVVGFRGIGQSNRSRQLLIEAGAQGSGVTPAHQLEEQTMQQVVQQLQQIQADMLDQQPQDYGLLQLLQNGQNQNDDSNYRFGSIAHVELRHAPLVNISRARTETPLIALQQQQDTILELQQDHYRARRLWDDLVIEDKDVDPHTENQART